MPSTWVGGSHPEVWLTWVQGGQIWHLSLDSEQLHFVSLVSTYKFYFNSSPQSSRVEVKRWGLSKGLCGVSSPTGLKTQDYSEYCCFHPLLKTQACWNNQVMQEENERGNAEWRVHLDPEMILAKMQLCLHFPALSCHCTGNFYWDVKIQLPTHLHSRKLSISMLVLLKLLFKGDWLLKNTRFFELYVTKGDIYLHILHNILSCRNFLNTLNWCLLEASTLKKIVQSNLRRIISSTFLKKYFTLAVFQLLLIMQFNPNYFFTSFLWQDFESLLLNCFGISSSPYAASYHLCHFISISYFSR